MRICSSIPKHPTVQAHTDNHKILPRAHMLQRFFWNPVRVSTKHLFLCLLLSWKKEGQDLQLVQTSTDTLKIKTLCTVQPWYQFHISSAKLQVVLIRRKLSDLYDLYPCSSWLQLEDALCRNSQKGMARTLFAFSEETQQLVSTAFLDQWAMLQKQEILQNMGPLVSNCYLRSFKKIKGNVRTSCIQMTSFSQLFIWILWVAAETLIPTD